MAIRLRSYGNARAKPDGQDGKAGAEQASGRGTQEPPHGFDAHILRRDGYLTRAERAEGEDDGGPVRYDLSFSSEDPYRRTDFWSGKEFDEVLVHTKAAVDIDRLNSGAAPFLDSHFADREGIVGVIEKGSVKIKDGKGYARVRMDTGSELAQTVMRQIDMGLTSVSVGYRVNKWQITERDNAPDEWRAIDWTPMEVSSVAVPATWQVGIGREGEQYFIRSVRPGEQPPTTTREETGMDEEREVTQEVTQEVRTEPTPPPAPAPQAVQVEPRNDAAQLLAMGKEFDSADVPAVQLAHEAIEQGRDLDWLRNAILNATKEAMNPKGEQARTRGNIGMTQQEVQGFSFCRAILALSDRENAEYREAASFELDAMRAAAKANGGIQGVSMMRDMAIPMDVLNAPLVPNRNAAEALRQYPQLMERATMVTGTANLGGDIVATILAAASFQDLMVAMTPEVGMWTTLTTGMGGNIDIPIEAKSPTQDWLAETAAGSEENLEVGKVTMQPRRMYSQVDYSRQMLLQATPSIEAIVRTKMVTARARKLVSAWYGSGGANQPNGMTTSGTLGAANAAPVYNRVTLRYFAANGLGSTNPTNGEAVDEGNSWQAVTSALGLLAAADAPVGMARFFISPQAFGSWLGLVKGGSGSGRFVIDDVSDTIAGRPYTVSSLIPAVTRGNGTTHDVFVTAPGISTYYATWGAGDEIIVDPYSAKQNATIQVAMNTFQDFALVQPSAIVAIRSGVFS